jgi:hypothetical protein
MENKLVLEFGNNKLVVEIDSSYLPEIPPEIFVTICDKDENIMQNLVIVRPHYEFDKEKDKSVIDNNRVDCIVWADFGSEDYTSKFVVDVPKEEWF